jgi:hypothetical protein
MGTWSEYRTQGHLEDFRRRFRTIAVRLAILTEGRALVAIATAHGHQKTDAKKPDAKYAAADKASAPSAPSYPKGKLRGESWLQDVRPRR